MHRFPDPIGLVTAKVVSDNIDEEDTNIASLNATFSDELLDISRRLPG